MMGYLDKSATYIIAGVGSLYAFVTGNFNIAFQVLLGIMVLDLLSGLFKGAKKGGLKSIIMHMGLMKKSGLMIAIVFAHLLDMAVNDGQPVFSTMMTWASIGNESLSVIENLEALGVKLPNAITDTLGQVVNRYQKLHDEKDKDIDDVQ